jgi:hypothetical protein
MRSGEPSRYDLTGSLAGTGKLRIALFIAVLLFVFVLHDSSFQRYGFSGRKEKRNYNRPFGYEYALLACF